jgi:hypothetical protein
MSHYYLLMLAPLLTFVRADFQVHFLVVRRGERDLCFDRVVWIVAPAGGVNLQRSPLRLPAGCGRETIR